MHSCNICESKHINFSGELIIFKKKIKLYSCINCQYTFTEKPYWLEKSYNQVINDTDVGLISRNLFNSNLVFSIIKYFGTAVFY